jgi:L-lactate dehydrogenase
MVLCHERAVIPIGSFQREFDVTLSLPSVIGCEGVVRVMQPVLSAAEESALERSADNLRRALERARS